MRAVRPHITVIMALAHVQRVPRSENSNIRCHFGITGVKETMANKKKRLVYFENWVDPVAEMILASDADVELHRLRYGGPQDDTWQIISQAHGYQIAPRGELKEPWFGGACLLEKCPSLLAITSTGAGFDMIDVEACTGAGVIVCNQSGSNREAVAEHALGMMLCLSKKIMVANRAMKRVDALDRFAYTGNDLKGKVVGIVGIGHIGSRTTELCRAFGMTVLAYDPYLTEWKIAQWGAVKVELMDLLHRSDFVSVHCPRSSETMNMFGRAEFEAMKPTAYFINTARGGIHDEEALLAALVEHRIAGAGIDVFLREPPPTDHQLLLHDSVVSSPHIAGLTYESLHNMARFAAEQWLTIFSGDVPPRLVNPEAWPMYCERFECILGFRPHGQITRVT